MSIFFSSEKIVELYYKGYSKKIIALQYLCNFRNLNPGVPASFPAALSVVENALYEDYMRKLKVQRR